MAFFNRQRYVLICWTVMPNHVHVILRLLEEHRLDQVMQSVKRHSAREINTILGRHGTFWHEEYFDTLMRSPLHLERATKYVLGNPAKAGLASEGRVGFDADAYAELIW
ncbi:MAG TPA: transposase [Thermoanaerobaculia bacterium]|nr:transposase [Thermoanaerobaculia bacterium]